MSEENIKYSSNPGRRRVWIGVASALLVAVVVLLFWTEDTADVTRSDVAASAQAVTVFEVHSADSVATISAFAELRPRWDADIRAAVSGRIINVNESALAGERVETGALLFTIEKTPYETSLAAAALSVDQAKLALVNAKNDVALAREEAELLNVSQPNELVLRLPQLRIAERSVASAKAQLEDARRQLSDTDVRAPFSGVVTERMASLGQTVAVGEPLVHLSDNRHYELVVELRETDWALLERPIAGQDVKLYRRSGALLGKARIRQGGGYLDQQTRQPRIFIDVADPSDDVIAGDFVRVEFTGRRVAKTLTIPEAALTRSGFVWMVDADDLLVRMEPEILFRADGDLIIEAPGTAGPWRIAATPLASFLPGLRVAPKAAPSASPNDHLARRQAGVSPDK